MMKFRHILGALDGLKHWVDAHLSWFFTNGNKARAEELNVSSQDDQAI